MKINILALAALIGASVYMSLPVSAQSAIQSDIQLAADQFKSAGIVPDVIDRFNPIGALVVKYAGTSIATGAAVLTNDLTVHPELSIRAAEDAARSSTSPFNAPDARFTIIVVDGNTQGSNNPNNHILQWLGNGYKITSKVVADGVQELTLGDGFDVSGYLRPSPPPADAPRRYTWLVYAEPADFVAPSEPAAGSNIVYTLDPDAYAAAAKLGDPIAGSYFMGSAPPDTSTSLTPTATPNGAAATA